jgi:endoglucanase
MSGAGSGSAGTNASGGTPGGGAAGTRNMPAPVVDKPSTDTTWGDGLSTGPNGPIPRIVVDQFGYRSNDPKVAVIRSPQTGYDSSAPFTPGTTYSVVSKSSGETIKMGAPTSQMSRFGSTELV